MSDKKPRTYLKGSVKEPSFANSTGDLLNMDIEVQGLVDIANEKGYAKICVQRRKEVDDYGNSHYIYVNEFVADPNYKAKAKPEPKKEANEDDLPF